MAIMQSHIEKVPQRQGMSWRYKKIDGEFKPSDWHHHQEFELVINRNISGKVNIGHYQGEFSHNSMMLIAPNLPHAFETTTVHNPQHEIHIIWFKKEWIANMMFACPELRKLDVVLKRAEKGLSFSPQAADLAVESLKNLVQHTAICQLGVLLQVLDVIASDKETTTLLSYSPQPSTADKSSNKEKVERLSQYIEAHYHLPLTLASLADHMNTSESTIHRWFDLHFRESFSQHLKKVRLNHAAELLQSTNQPVSLICENVGYRNQANFNRQFKQYKLMTPREYRYKFKIGHSI
ncbi:AraC family transcriptional regulator [Photobacterium makurazakiensis]|uniref:AraC family transcriptional regulator n=1 Tax=Photobacterium makurazakiensis TaxID=2910234 RepID=UPI003D0C00D7